MDRWVDGKGMKIPQAWESVLFLSAGWPRGPDSQVSSPIGSDEKVVDMHIYLFTISLVILSHIPSLIYLSIYLFHLFLLLLFPSFFFLSDFYQIVVLMGGGLLLFLLYVCVGVFSFFFFSSSLTVTSHLLRPSSSLFNLSSFFLVHALLDLTVS